MSFRVGLLIGSLAAGLMTAGAIIVNQELGRHLFDAVLMFLYFEVFFVFLSTVLEFLLIFLVGIFLRYAGGRVLLFTGQAVSFLIGLAFFAYFFYWGRTQSEFFRLFSGVTLTTMFLVLVLGCVFVAKCSWLGFLVAFREMEVGRFSPNWRRSSTQVMIAFVVVLLVIPFALEREPKELSGSTPVAVLTTPDRWMVLGIDGLSLEILNRQIQSGSLPHFQKLQEESYRAPLRITEQPIPPVVWTSIATGVSSAQHGIRVPEVRRWGGLSSWMQMTPLEMAVHSITMSAGLGQRQPVSGYSRKTGAFWEILSETGLRAGVVNWWGSWPAQEIRGWNVSERYYYKLLSGDPPQEETFPPDLFSRYSIPTEQRQGRIQGQAIDRFYAQVFQDQVKTSPVRVAALYLPGLDILNYEFFEVRRIDPFAYTDQYRKHLQWMDHWMQELEQSNPEFRILLILYQGRSLPNDHSGLWIHSPENSEASPVPFQETEITPLLLYSCGLPLGQHMPYALVQAWIPKQRLQQTPLRFTSSYPSPASALDAAHAEEFNDLLVEQMKSLGYLQ